MTYSKIRGEAMRRVLGIVLVLVFTASMLVPLTARAQNASEGTGGATAFFVGCCFGLRVGTQWNEGVDLHWREWATIIPGFSIWNGIDCLNGLTGHEFAEQYGANWY